MTRLRVILALSHACLLAGVFGFYFDPESRLLALLAAGAFLRWMVPAKPSRRLDPLRSILTSSIIGALISWLMDLGLSELLAEAWADRLSIRPLLLFSAVVFYLLVDDWRGFLKLSENQIDEFYSRKTGG